MGAKSGGTPSATQSEWIHLRGTTSELEVSAFTWESLGQLGSPSAPAELLPHEAPASNLLGENTFRAAGKAARRIHDSTARTYLAGPSTSQRLPRPRSSPEDRQYDRESMIEPGRQVLAEENHGS